MADESLSLETLWKKIEKYSKRLGQPLPMKLHQENNNCTIL
jgi:hypothetical protein